MSKRPLKETSTEHSQTEKRYSATKTNDMGSPSVQNVETIMRQILRENNDELFKQLATKSDLQHLHTEFANLQSRHEDITQRVVQLENQNKILEEQIEKMLQKKHRIELTAINLAALSGEF